MRLDSTFPWESLKAHRSAGKRQSGAVLLEVILALVLFVAAAAILSSGLSSSLDALERLRMTTHAADLAVSVLSELQLGIKNLTLSGPQRFEQPWEGWTWELLSTPVQSETEDASPFRKIEVVIRHEEPALVYRLTEVLQVDNSAQAEGASGAGSF